MDSLLTIKYSNGQCKSYTNNPHSSDIYTWAKKSIKESTCLNKDSIKRVKKQANGQYDMGDYHTVRIKH